MKPSLSSRYIARLRLLSQSLFASFCLVVGLQFYQFYLWATGTSDHIAPFRPPAVEAFLPLGALVSLKRLVLSGEYDAIHPAGLTIFLAALFLGLFLRKGFCGWICPIGFASNLAEKTGRKLRLLMTIPSRIGLPLLSLKYLLLITFSWLIIWKMNLQEINSFHFSSYNLVSDGKMLHFFLHPSLLAGSIMLFLTILSFIMKNPWCRYLCPYGGLLGILAIFSPFQVKRNQHLCIDCKRCEAVCPASIEITNRRTVRNCECIGCLECLPVCPQEECLTLSMPGKATSIPPLLMPTLIIGSFLLFWLLAKLSNHWQSLVPLSTFQHYYQQLQSIGHP
jgi:polyferredoxin